MVGVQHSAKRKYTTFLFSDLTLCDKNNKRFKAQKEYRENRIPLPSLSTNDVSKRLPAFCCSCLEPCAVHPCLYLSNLKPIQKEGDHFFLTSIAWCLFIEPHISRWGQTDNAGTSSELDLQYRK